MPIMKSTDELRLLLQPHKSVARRLGSNLSCFSFIPLYIEIVFVRLIQGSV